MSAPLIILTAGGTGGHVFPADALAEALLHRGARVALITDARGKGYGGTLGRLETFGVSAAQMLGRGLLDKLRGALALARGVKEARAILTRLRPEAVVGFGGYASVPAVGAALALSIPVVLHEQNAVLGRANRLFARKAARIALSFPATAALPKDARTIHTGMPVRAAIGAVRGLPYAPPKAGEPVRLLVLGGSQGARAFSDLLPDALKLLPPELAARLDLAQQCRPEDLERVRAAYAAAPFRPTLDSFFADVPERLGAAHLLIARSGSSTVAEAAVAGRPALYVPYPHAADDHQTANAQAVAEAGGAWVLPQSALTPEGLAERLRQILTDGPGLAAAALAASTFAQPDAAARLAEAVLNVAAQKNEAL